MKKASLKVATPPRSRERQALAEAIENLIAAEERQETIHEAQRRAREIWYTASDALSAAETALEEAKAAEPQRLVDELIGNVTHHASLDAINAVVAAANADIKRSDDARVVLDELEKAVHLKVDLAKMQVKDRIADVIRTDEAVARLYAEYAERRRRLEELFPIFWKLNMDLPKYARDWNLCFEVNVPLAPDSPWAVALAALERDADAELPKLT